MTRYILRETFGAWLIVVAVLLVILIANQFAQILGDAASDRLPRDAVLAILGLTLLRYLSALTPIALLLGVMWALARLNRDGEMAALSACGIGPGRLLVPVGLLTAALATVLVWLALFQTPAAGRRIEEIKFQAKQELKLGSLEPGKFMSPGAGNTVLYVGSVADDELRDVFFQSQQGERVVAILADRARRVMDPATGELTFVFYDGRWYDGIPGSTQFLRGPFEEASIPVRGNDDEGFVETAATKPTRALLHSSDPVDRAELEWRLSTPLSLFVLALLAVPLSRSSPREGRYARLGVGLLLYIVYTNLLSIAQVWVAHQVVPDWVGMWWVHAVAALFALLLLVRQSGVFARAPQVAQAEPA